ncbi:hypothetical protein [Flavobacterium sp. NKUCC04_CG]|uniref:hypothetical protein n=1 Tax=Flavobacterium sp. NKUCC04_CG TaxID=2842121 RepID=UPI001C5BE288|nr:hypothetical protein [Flavobacterium sp. NKUCC04_CG]MBW3519536.1 hypothetical protein [Flavobacterium sp. NKUCC04_CG]
MYKYRIKAFFDAKGMNNRDIATKLEYNEGLVSRWMNADTISKSFLYLLLEHFPEIDLNYLLKGDEVIKYNNEDHLNLVKEKNKMDINIHLNAIQQHTEKIQEILAQKGLQK